MKKNILYAFLLSVVMFLSGCGSNSIEDPIGGGSATGGTSPTGQITTTLQDMTIDQKTGTIVTNVALTSTYASTVESTLDNMNINLGGCTLQTSSLSVNPNIVKLTSALPTQNVVLSGILSDATCVPNSYQITGTNNILENGTVVTEDFATSVVAIDDANVTIEDSSTVTLRVATQQLDINESGVSENITVNVIKGQVGEVNQNVVIKNINSLVGSFSLGTVASDAAGDAVFTYTSPDPMVDSNLTVEFCLEENTSMCDTATINLTTTALAKTEDPIDNINYFITFVPNNGVNNLALGTRNNAIATLINKDTGAAIPSDRIHRITITSRDLSILKLTPEGGGIPQANISKDGQNAIPVLLTADKQNAGLAILEVVIEYENLNGVTKTRGQLFSVAVLSGEATAFSINDAGISYNEETKQFEQKYIVQATDASSNPIATTGYITVSAIASFAKDASGREILYGRFANDNEGISATVSPTNDGRAMLELNGGLTPFNTTNIDQNRAFVSVFSRIKDTYESNGKWNIEQIIDGNTLEFSNEYYGETHTDLGMAIGYNYREKMCTSVYSESVLVVDSTDGTYLLDEKGQAYVTLKFDSYMIGKRAMVLVNMTGLNPDTGKVQRSGEVYEETLRFHDPLKGASVTVKGGQTVSFRHWGVITTGTDDKFPFINSIFICDEIEGTDNIQVISRSYSDPTSCTNSGQAYIDYTVTTQTGEDGSFALSKCTPSDNPQF